MAAGAPDIGSLLAALQQGGGAGPPAGPVGGQPGPPAPATPGAPQNGGGDEGPSISILQQMISLAQRYMQVEPDEEDKATMAKVLMTLQQ